MGVNIFCPVSCHLTDNTFENFTFLRCNYHDLLAGVASDDSMMLSCLYDNDIRLQSCWVFFCKNVFAQQ